MTYKTSNDQGRQMQAATIEGALCHAVMMIYIGDQDRHRARAELKTHGKTTITYGFKTVTIEEETA